MPNEMPENLNRRIRHCSTAILTAIALTLAALIAFTIASQETSTSAVKTTGPVTRIPAATDANSGLVPVINR
jgi:hypothetical protein